ncbi:MAG: cobalamin B12-binding domain-containing protein [Anaerolineales bacterium]|jgi:methylmalonyl-CoA mutase cobalamin-binding subunit|nr:cobalamin B12-binding domain-containing protein [Anaerolineales bacterium]MDX9937243.1 cobalamin B12-binding domain-containing protein [Anaerolineales bacterium]GER77972.1 methionine synthase [Candidatus Denitrolinea symbiosum]
MTNARRTVVAAALGECVHVAGVMNFLRLAEAAGWRTVFLGPAVATEDVLAAARREDADLVGVSYRLTPETGERLLGEFAEAADELRESGVRFAFGGTPPVAERAKALQFFERVFDGSEPVEAVLGYLKGQNIAGESSQQFPQTAIERIRWKSPYPILRHHFGLPTMEDTLAGIEKIAEAQALDVISLGIDQDAQENFYHPERQDPRRKGAGGVPVRSEADYRALYAASRRGNFPLLRAYSGTDDFIRLAEMYADTIHIAWCAIPLFWFNQMDGRGPWDLEGSIREHQQVMQWYGARGIPVELNEPHHWGMRDASDAVFVAAAFLSAYNTRAFGVRDYIAQMMFNSPPGLSDKMDLAKMLTALDLITPLASPSPHFTEQNGENEGGFRIWKQTRIGLLSHPLDPEAARGHLAASTYLQMSLRPHIYHIVGHTEADHAATADDVIVASRVARRAIENALGAPDLTADPIVARRRAELAAETNAILDAIRALAGPDAADPFTDAATLARAVTSGILDAPQLVNNKFGRGEVRTRIVDGACVSVDGTGNPISERERIAKLI